MDPPNSNCHIHCNIGNDCNFTSLASISLPEEVKHDITTTEFFSYNCIFNTITVERESLMN